jgi:hypothetical protein
LTASPPRPPGTPIRLALVDDGDLVRAGLRTLLGVDRRTKAAAYYVQHFGDR